jgi:cytochrome P450 PksS
MKINVDFGLALTSPDALANPYPTLRRMRCEDLAHYSETLGAWFLTRYADVLQAFRDPRLSSDRTRAVIDARLGSRDRAIVKDFERFLKGTMFNKDGAEHFRLRRLANHGFTPTLLDGMRPKIQRVADELLDGAGTSGRMDLVADYAQPLPIIVICELFGIPTEDRHRFRKWSDDSVQFFFGLTHGDVETDARMANEATVNLQCYFHDLLEERRLRPPGNDLLSLLIAGQDEGRLSAEEVTAQCQLILIAGHVTTIHQLCNAVHAFLEHPEQLQRLRSDPSLINSAVEEVLRYDPPAPFVRRVATADMEIGGKAIREGELVFLAVAAANHDPEVFANPDCFDIGRAENRHIAFGSGAHACLGSGLTRRELEIGLMTLFRRLPRLGFDPESRPRRRCSSFLLRGFDTFPVVTS